MYVDVDFFKRVNDEHGHVVGDEVLKIVGKRLSEIVRQSDTVARMGGDEFIVLQALVRARDARKLAARIRESLEQPMVVGPLRLHVSASVGIAFFPEDADAASALIARADEALYRAKAEGRNRIAFYSLEPDN
jgi:diguanylate cyclase (GGDEF)-like protein